MTDRLQAARTKLDGQSEIVLKKNAHLDGFSTKQW
jgi:hypothetical protein